METMKLEQLIQATSGLSNRKETPVLVNGQPINEWLYVISIPEKDKMVLEEICKGYKIKIEDLARQFYLWVMREPEAAAQWLNGEAENKKV